MLILLPIWLFLGVEFWCLGTLLLEFCFPHAVIDQQDKFWVSQWLGIVILANLLLVISFFIPLTTAVGITIWILAIGAVILWRRTRLKLQELLGSLNRRSIYAGLIVVILVSAFSSTTVTFYDTGLYHYQVIKWLANFGAVPGLGLVHNRFAFPAPFFTISAILDQGIFTNRAGGVVTGFIILILLSQLLAIVHKITDASQEKFFSDYFLAVYSGYTLISVCVFSFGILKSLSPDPIVAFMSGIPLWVMLIDRQNSSPSTCLIAVLLASGLVSFKWSGLVILGVVYIWAIFNFPKSNLKEFIFNGMLISGIALLPLIPTLSYGFITSGCPLFPSGILCMDVPWGVGKLRAEEVKLIITNWQKWGAVTPPDPNPWGWLIPWAQREVQAVIQICVSITCSFLTLFQSPKNVEWRPISKYVLGMGLGGIVYMMVLSPAIRFGVGYVSIIPAFWLAQFISCRTFGKRWEVGLWLALVIFWLIPIVYYRSTDLLMPQQLPQASQLETKQAIDFSYLMPQNDDRCWSADLPCTPENLDRVRLLNPDRGIGGGFRRAD